MESLLAYANWQRHDPPSMSLRFARLLGMVGRAVTLPILVPCLLILIAGLFLWDAELGLLRRAAWRARHVAR